ncbi:MAG: hypothetical protein AAF743_12375, partial [Planctomycetota bacterium]
MAAAATVCVVWWEGPEISGRNAMNDQQHHQQVSELFARAVEIPTDERERFVRDQANAPSIAEEVLSLLASASMEVPLMDTLRPERP